MSIESKFNKVCKIRLSEYGFRKLKGMNILARLVNDDIVHYISIQSCGSLQPGMKAYKIIIGIQTKYSPELNQRRFEIAGVSLMALRDINQKLYQLEGPWDIFHYDDNSMDIVLERSFEMIKEIALPVLDTVTDLSSYINYCKKIRLRLLCNADKMYNDSLVLIQADNHDDFNDAVLHHMGLIARKFSKGIQEYLNEEAFIKNSIYEVVSARDLVFNNPNLLDAARKELERRSICNQKVFAKLGIS